MFTQKVVSILLNYNTESYSKYLWRQEASEIFNLGTYASYLLNDPALMFEFMEANKAFILAQNINEKRQLLNLPEEISNADNTFKRKILDFESKLDSFKVSSDRNSLFDLKANYQKFKDSIHSIYPEYLQLNQRIEPIALTKIKNNLHANDVVLYYALNDTPVGEENESLIGLLITSKKNIAFKVKNSSKTLQTLRDYRASLSHPLAKKSDFFQFKSNAYFLYNQLFPTAEIKELIKNKNLLIVSDVSLENTPLEALITTKNELHYLIEDCNISYAYSLTFSELNKNIQRKNKQDITLFAPINFTSKKVSSLPYSQKEAKNIEKIISGHFYQNNLATKYNFLHHSSDSKIIHLATHADGSSKPVIHFSDTFLPLRELYTYKNNADLVVLSACETNLGEIKKGEGILNLARGFFHSGANAVVSSLWKINDASTSGIMDDFYKNLQNKQSKLLALNNAKRTYLKNHQLSEKSPYYWASFVLIGDTNPVFKTNYILYIAIIVVFTLVFLIFINLFKNRKNNYD